MLLMLSVVALAEAKSPRALIITGQHKTHNWKVSHVILDELLREGGYDVDIAMSPEQGEDMSQFCPKFNRYDVVVMDYNGDMWCEKMQRDFVRYVKRAKGGLYLYHAANTIFRDWEEYNKITALGAFGGRGPQTPGYYTEWKDGGVVKYEDQDIVGHHGVRHDFPLICRNSNHPAVDPSLANEPLQLHDEVYDHTKGPANIKDVLYTGYSSLATGGTGKEELLVFTVDYGKSRIVNSMIGHVGDSREESPAITSPTFKAIFLAAVNWVAGE